MVCSLIFWALAAMCNSVMDTITHHYYRSIFYKPQSLNNDKWNNFWNPELSWKSAFIIPLTHYKLDAWHLFKSLMIIFQGIAIIFAWTDNPPFIENFWFNCSVLIIMGFLWNLTFNIFYNKILIIR